MTNITIGILIAFADAVIFAIYFVTMKAASKKTSDFVTLSFLAQISSSILFIPLLFTETFRFDSSPNILLLLIAALILAATAGILRYGANNKIEASLSIIVSRLTFVISFVGAIFILGEALVINRLLGVVVLLIGVGALFVKNKNSNFLNKSGIIFAMSSAALYGVGQIIDGGISKHYSPALYSGVITIGVGAFMALYFFFIGKRISNLIQELKVNYKLIILLGLTNTISYFCMIVSYQYIDKSLALPIINSTVALTVIFSYIFLKERDHLLRKSISVALIFAGIVFVSLS